MDSLNIQLTSDNEDNQSTLNISQRSRFKYFCKTLITEKKASFRHWPVFILTISILQLGVFNYDIVQTNEHKSDLPIENIGRSLKGPAAELLIFHPKKLNEFWRNASYVLVHVGYDHIIFNIVIQIFLGLPLEMEYGLWVISVLYITSAMHAAVVSSIIDPTIYLAGASSSVYALFGFQIGTIIFNSKQRGTLFLLGLFVIIDIVRSVISKSIRICYISHLVGSVVGFLYGLII